MFYSHEDHMRLLKQREFDIAPEKFWMQVLSVGQMHSHLLAAEFQLVGTEIPRGMDVGRELVF